MPQFDESEDQIKYRVRDPSQFVDDSFRSKGLGDGVSLVMGKKADGGDAMVVQSVSFKKPEWNLDKAKKWVDENKNQFEMEPDKLFSINGVEIFSVGKWNGHEITEKDLDAIVDSFNQTNQFVTPALKLGHDDNQEMLKAEGLPAAGWIENLRRSGDKLLADFVDMPRKIFQLVKNKAYRKVSCEIFNNIDFDGKKLPKLLGAVALLGSELPGVLNLNDMLSLYSKDIGNNEPAWFAHRKAPDIIMTETALKESDDMPGENSEKLKFQLEQEQKEKEKLSKDLEQAMTSVNELKEKFSKLEGEKKESEKKLAESLKKEKEANIDKFVSELKADKLISKAMEGPVKQLLDDSVDKFSIKDSEGKDSEVDRNGLIKHLFSLAKEVSKVNFDDQTGDDKGGGGKDNVSHIEKYAKEHDLSFSEAYRKVNKEKQA